MSQIYILIDGSYYIFYRLYALINWWKLSHKDEPCENLHENPEFIKKFRSIFVDKIREIPKKLKIPKSAAVKYIIGRDCKRSNIWRNQIYPNYKGTRDDYTNSLNPPGPFFKLVYEEGLFENIDNIDITMLHHDELEADDCLAICTKHLTNRSPENIIYIITSDTDYLQLLSDNVKLVNLKYKNINTDKNSLGCPEKDLLYKIIIGDKSDNIPSVFNKCGPKSAMKYINDSSLFEEELEKQSCHSNYTLNRTLIDFACIPDDLSKHIEEKCKHI